MTQPPYTANGKQILHNGVHWADMASAVSAEALIIALNSAEMLFHPDIPDDVVDRVSDILWPELAPGYVPPTQPLDTMLSQPWEA